MDESKWMIVHYLHDALTWTRAGENVKKLELSMDEKTVEITFYNGSKKYVDVEADSGISLIRDICAALM